MTADVIHDPATDWCACTPEGDERCDYRLLADAVIAKLNPRDGDEAEVALCITAVVDAAAVRAEVLKLADDMDAKAEMLAAAADRDRGPSRMTRAMLGARAQVLRECAKALREAITTALTGKETSDGH